MLRKTALISLLLLLNLSLAIVVASTRTTRASTTAPTRHAVAVAPSQLTWEAVDARAQQWLPTAQERKWETSGWVSDLVTGEKLARENHRPMIVICVTGDLDQGHC